MLSTTAAVGRSRALSEHPHNFYSSLRLKRRRLIGLRPIRKLQMIDRHRCSGGDHRWRNAHVGGQHSIQAVELVGFLGRSIRQVVAHPAAEVPAARRGADWSAEPAARYLLAWRPRPWATDATRRHQNSRLVWQISGIRRDAGKFPRYDQKKSGVQHPAESLRVGAQESASTQFIHRVPDPMALG